MELVSNECWYIQKDRPDLDSIVQENLKIRASAVLTAGRAVIHSTMPSFLVNSNFRMNYGTFPQLEAYEKKHGNIDSNTIISYAVYASSDGLIPKDDKRTLDQMMELIGMDILE